MVWNLRKSVTTGRLAQNRRGNFGIMTALSLPVILAAAGVAIDVSSMILRKAELQDAADTAALAAASALSNDGKTANDAKALAVQYLKTQLATNQASVKSTVEVKETVLSGSSKQFKVSVTASDEFAVTPFTRLLGQSVAKVAANSFAESATESKNALSLFLVLDKSGSMSWITDERDPRLLLCVNITEANYGKLVLPSIPCYITKMAALKTAVSSLFAQFNKADPKNTLVRTAAIAYDDRSDPPTALSWGTATAATYVNALSANGATASAGAMKIAYDKLRESAENTAHRNKNGQVPTKYIVFMTDGENSLTADDVKTRETCDDARNDGIKIYSVAFMAPTAGKVLLKYCATDITYYFEAEDMATLVAAFKSIGEGTTPNTRITQ